MVGDPRECGAGGDRGIAARPVHLLAAVARLSCIPRQMPRLCGVDTESGPCPLRIAHRSEVAQWFGLSGRCQLVYRPRVRTGLCDVSHRAGGGSPCRSLHPAGGELPGETRNCAAHVGSRETRALPVRGRSAPLLCCQVRRRGARLLRGDGLLCVGGVHGVAPSCPLLPSRSMRCRVGGGPSIPTASATTMLANRKIFMLTRSEISL